MTPDTADQGRSPTAPATAATAAHAAREWLMRQTPQDFPGLTERERLTLLAHVIRSVVTPDGSYRALIDYIADLGVPIYELLAPAEPLTTDHYTRPTLEHLTALLSWNKPPPGSRVVR